MGVKLSFAAIERCQNRIQTLKNGAFQNSHSTINGNYQWAVLMPLNGACLKKENSTIHMLFIDPEPGFRPQSLQWSLQDHLCAFKWHDLQKLSKNQLLVKYHESSMRKKSSALRVTVVQYLSNCINRKTNGYKSRNNRIHQIIR